MTEPSTGVLLMQKPTENYNAIETVMMSGLAFKTILESVRVGLFDTLEKDSKSSLMVAEEMGFDQAGTEALLNLLTAHDLLEKSGESYKNTPCASEFLVSTSPFFQGHSMEMHNRFNEAISEDIAGLLRGERQIRSVIDENWGLDDSMNGTAQHALLGAVQDTTDFTKRLPGFMQMRSMCDIGGNHGEFSMELLDLNAELCGEIADLPHVAKTSNKRIENCGYSERLKAFACDLRKESLGSDKYDLVLASHVLYAFTDDLEDLLCNIYESLRPGGWFVSHHLNAGGDFNEHYINAVQFITRLSGYKSHLISEPLLSSALKESWFSEIISSTAGLNDTKLILAAKKQ